MSTNFFQRQDRARRNTARLVILFILSVITLIALTYFPFLFLYHATNDGRNTATATSRPLPSGKQTGSNRQPSPPAKNSATSVQDEVKLWEPGIFLASAMATLSVVGLGSAYKVSQLASGGKSVALLLGGKEIQTNTRSLHERKILNVVEEMAIASGIPVPAVFLLTNEPGINAFAAGYAPEDAVVAVSQGALDYLTRDELQGVVAHEFSHIFNGDMRLNIRLVGLIHGLIVLSLLGFYLMRIIGEGTRGHQRSRNSNDKDGGAALIAALFVVGLAVYIIGSVGAFFGWIMQAAVSRQREFLADASAVQFTRNPDGIAGALKKIGGLQVGSFVKNANASEVSHMFFANAMRSSFTSLFATHPPLKDRIMALDPSWDGKFPQVRLLSGESEPERTASRERGGVRGKRHFGLPGMPELPLPVAFPAFAADTVVERIGTVPEDSRESASAFEEDITPEVLELIGETFSARSVIFALLLDSDPDVLARQLHVLRVVSEPKDVHEMFRNKDRVLEIPPGTQLAVAHFAMPALRRMSPYQYKAFRVVIDGMIAADGRVSLSEFCLKHLLTNYLDRAFGLKQTPPTRYTHAASLQSAAERLLGLLAWHGHDGAAASSAAAYGAAIAEWNAASPKQLPEQSTISLDGFAAALNMFETASPELKKQLIRAVVVCIVNDRVVTSQEYELVRTICSALDCPFPPIGTHT